MALDPLKGTPGLYVLGLPYLRRRKSSFMHGAEDDVRELGAHLADYLDRATTQVQAAAHRGSQCDKREKRVTRY